MLSKWRWEREDIMKVIYSYTLYSLLNIKPISTLFPRATYTALESNPNSFLCFINVYNLSLSYFSNFLILFFLLYAPGTLAIYSVPQTLQAYSFLVCNSSNFAFLSSNISLNITFCLTTQSKVSIWALAYSHNWFNFSVIFSCACLLADFRSHYI